ncbi:MAG: hypothetical protein KC776_41390 [Myxococcales bacterium]|nr:hypothetical protein [Myxococcales bacterium]MCB9581427.1 hypothetical protein [Polyangiaceae bacterium]
MSQSASPALVSLLAMVAVVGGLNLMHREGQAAPVDGSMRARIQRVVDAEVVPLKSEAEVDRYLDQLVARAHASGEVNALTVEPGHEAIARLEGIDTMHRLQKQAAFRQRMRTLSHELSRTQQKASP